jgi:hypothetical protein
LRKTGRLCRSPRTPSPDSQATLQSARRLAARKSDPPEARSGTFAPVLVNSLPADGYVR